MISLQNIKFRLPYLLTALILSLGVFFTAPTIAKKIEGEMKVDYKIDAAVAWQIAIAEPWKEGRWVEPSTSFVEIKATPEKFFKPDAESAFPNTDIPINMRFFKMESNRDNVICHISVTKYRNAFFCLYDSDNDWVFDYYNNAPTAFSSFHPWLEKIRYPIKNVRVTEVPYDNSFPLKIYLQFNKLDKKKTAYFSICTIKYAKSLAPTGNYIYRPSGWCLNKDIKVSTSKLPVTFEEFGATFSISETKEKSIFIQQLSKSTQTKIVIY